MKVFIILFNSILLFFIMLDILNINVFKENMSGCKASQEEEQQRSEKNAVINNLKNQINELETKYVSLLLISNGNVARVNQIAEDAQKKMKDMEKK